MIICHLADKTLNKKKTCKWAKEKAQEIEHHPSPMGARNPQDAVRLKNKTEAQRKAYIKKKKEKLEGLL